MADAASDGRQAADRAGCGGTGGSIRTAGGGSTQTAPAVAVVGPRWRRDDRGWEWGWPMPRPYCWHGEVAVERVTAAMMYIGRSPPTMSAMPAHARVPGDGLCQRFTGQAAGCRLVAARLHGAGLAEMLSWRNSPWALGDSWPGRGCPADGGTTRRRGLPICAALGIKIRASSSRRRRDATRTSLVAAEDCGARGYGEIVAVLRDAAGTEVKPSSPGAQAGIAADAFGPGRADGLREHLVGFAQQRRGDEAVVI